MGAPPPHGQAQEAGGESGNFRPAGCTVCPYLLPFTLLQVRQGIFAILDAFPALDLPRSFSVTRSRWGADPLCRGQLLLRHAGDVRRRCRGAVRPAGRPPAYLHPVACARAIAVLWFAEHAGHPALLTFIAAVYCIVAFSHGRSCS